MEAETKLALKGGEFLIKESDASDVFIPEEFSEEQRMIAQSADDFVEKEVIPNLDRIDAMEEGLNVELINKAGELGLLGVHIPEQYGGFGKGFVSEMLVAESLGDAHAISVSLMAHMGIGTLPVLYYGTEEQKNKYVPKLASGEWKSAYCLTEPSSGSDANSGKTSAKLTDDGKHYILNGQKMWITNGGFADFFTVFAKIDDDKNLSAFLVEKDFGGVTINAEEKKMGIKGSSTCQVFFENCKVPVENLLSERGNGFKIALNILNVGRAKLGAAVLGAGKRVILNSIKYSNERMQFGRPISKYGAIRYKLAEQAIRTYVLESSIYRAANNIEMKVKDLENEGLSHENAILKGVEQFAVECAILKVFGSEVLDYVADEGVQIYGGMGYSAEAPMDRAYRDSRINRIFEGTNEINRMLAVDMMLKKGMKGELDLMGPAMAVANELMSVSSDSGDYSGPLANERKYLVNFKKVALMVAGSAVQKLMQTLAKEQEILMNIADILIKIYAAESALLRTEKLIGIKGEGACTDQINMTKLYFYDTADSINKFGKDAIASFTSGDEQKMMLMGLKRFTKTEAVNVKEIRQSIAEKLIDQEKYCY
ncbi:MAG: acyl-CoA dehydrogenase family protein [Flavobacteriales bacterium]|nr:acyl-CoA dehydrogenase family protein [Flavobacteriales bacterium]